MKCPNCGDAADSMCITYGTASSPVAFFQCSCGLSGPREVLESLSRRLSPEGVMDEAERLLIASGVYQVGIDEGVLPGDVVVRTNARSCIAATLAAAYAKLVANNPERPDSSGGG